MQHKNDNLSLLCIINSSTLIIKFLKMLLNEINAETCLKSAYTCKIGKVFKKRRKLLSLTEFEVASQLYINVNYIKGIEQGDYSVFPARVFAKQYFCKYADYLNLKISFFDIYNTEQNSS